MSINVTGDVLYMLELCELYAVLEIFTYPIDKIRYGSKPITFLSTMSVTCHALIFVTAKSRNLKRDLILIELPSKH
jgi:hypothetical protein